MFKFVTLLLTIQLVCGKSPDSTNIFTDLIGSFRGPEAWNMTEFLSVFQMPDCLQKCMPDMKIVMDVVKQNKNDSFVLSKLCNDLQESTSCAEKAGCSKIFTDAAKHAFQFACMNTGSNITDFHSSLECLQDASVYLQPECEDHCQIQGKLLEKNTFTKLDEIASMPNMCNSSVCLLRCFHERIGSKCQGPANFLDSLLSSLMRLDGNGDDTFDKALKWLLPKACKTENLLLHEQSNEFKKNNRPLSVGKAPVGLLRGMDDPPLATESNGTGIETALLLDGQFRTLQCQMYDWQRRPVNTPDFESLAKIMAAQLLPFTSSKRPTLSVPSDEDVHDAENRVEDRLRRDLDDEKSTVPGRKLKGESSDLIVPASDSLHIFSFFGMFYFVVLVLY